ncbi:hypothetical protein ABIB25_005139 [Nakamurella sp. UYEF19]
MNRELDTETPDKTLARQDEAAKVIAGGGRGTAASLPNTSPPSAE